MRVGGPYTVTVNYVGAGTAFAPQTIESLAVNLGTATDVNVSVKTINLTEKVVVVGQTDPVFSSERTGAATTITRDNLANLPNITGRLENVTRLTPQNGGGMSFAGQDSRENNITVDGSYFNNSFGLGNTPGDRTGVAPISLHALEQVQVNIAPFDVRQGNFVGAAVNSVTRSGTNEFRGSVYHQFRGDSMVGTEAHGVAVNPGTFTFGETGEWVGGPVVKNKAFFRTENERRRSRIPRNREPGWTDGDGHHHACARLGPRHAQGFLKSKLNFDPGTYAVRLQGAGQAFHRPRRLQLQQREQGDVPLRVPRFEH
jgi:hypothetical protein